MSTTLTLGGPCVACLWPLGDHPPASSRCIQVCQPCVTTPTQPAACVLSIVSRQACGTNQRPSVPSGGSCCMFASSFPSQGGCLHHRSSGTTVRSDRQAQDGRQELGCPQPMSRWGVAVFFFCTWVMGRWRLGVLDMAIGRYRPAGSLSSAAVPLPTVACKHPICCAGREAPSDLTTANVQRSAHMV